jgi:hypothetical protein
MTISRSSFGLVGAALVATAAALAPFAGGPARSVAGPPPHRLLPDLKTMRIHSDDLRVSRDGADVLLRLTNRLANRGRGPLEIQPSARSHDCDRDGNPDNDRDALQRVFFDADGNRVFDRGTDTRSERFKFGCERYDPRAEHWNVFGLARYELRRLHSGKPVAKATKVAYCTVDSERVFGGLPGSPERRYYPRGGCNEESTLGISVGWADEYYYGFPGQELDVTGVKHGRYCLVSTGDPDGLLRESDNSNNARRTRIGLHPGKQLARVLPGRCRIGG